MKQDKQRGSFDPTDMDMNFLPPLVSIDLSLLNLGMSFPRAQRSSQEVAIYLQKLAYLHLWTGVGIRRSHRY